MLRGNGLLKEVIEGRTEGKRPSGRKRLGMLSVLKDHGDAEIKRRSEDRESWRKLMDLSKDRKLEEKEMPSIFDSTQTPSFNSIPHFLILK